MRLGETDSEGESEPAPAVAAGASGFLLKASPIRTAKRVLYKKGRPSADEPTKRSFARAREPKVRKRNRMHNTFTPLFGPFRRSSFLARLDRSHFVVPHPPALGPIRRGMELEIGEQRRRL